MLKKTNVHGAQKHKTARFGRAMRLLYIPDSPTKPLPEVRTALRQREKAISQRKARRISKDALRSGVLSFCVTLFMIAFFGGASAAVYNTASVLYGKDAVVSVDKNENSVQFTWMDDTVSFPAETAERIAKFAASCSAWLPGNFRSGLLAAGGLHQLVFTFWNWADTLLQ
ncbi:MAG: hypothetical protein ACOX6U_06710 [Oscillospiraceae bacterium]|jgi:hypothetical protein